MAEKHVVVAGYDSLDYEVFIANEVPLLLYGVIRHWFEEVCNT